MRIKSFVCALTVLGLTALAPSPALAQHVSVTFYEELSPYGDWVVVENYGRVWRPYRSEVGADFIPYSTGGRWVLTNHGWMFEPSWRWGRTTFHYGRWYQDPFNGWVWVPDNVWAPAWVEWRVGGGYIGWAPSPPRYHAHVRTHWYFVENRHFVEPQIWQHRARAVNSDAVFETTRPIAPPSGQAWAPGPQVTDVRSATRLPIPERRIDGPPPAPRPMFPRDMPAAAPPPPAPGMQRGGPSAMPQPIDRAPPAAIREPPQGFAPSPHPQQREPMRNPPPGMAPTHREQIRREPMPFNQPPPPMHREPVRNPPMIQREPMQAPPPMIQQPPARAPMHQQPVHREPVRPPPQQMQPVPIPAEQPQQRNAPRRGQPGQPGPLMPAPGPQPGPPPGMPR